MARPKKPRFFDGVLLPDNLYPDPRGRDGYWQYVRIDGSKKTFQAKSTDAAIALADEANTLRAVEVATKVPSSDSILKQVELYIPYREKIDPKLPTKTSWKNYRSYLKQFAKQFEHLAINQIELKHIQPWWDELTGHAQRSRRAEFNKFFNYLMSKDAVPKLKGNPFSIADDKPRVLLRPITDKKKSRLSLDEFWRIYKAAGDLGLEFLQIGMGISLHTTMRRGDILRLRFDQHVIDNHLKVAISKSHEKAKKKGEGSNLDFDLKKSPALGKLINHAREISMKNRRCPFIISHRFDRCVDSSFRDHHNQVLPRYFSDAFAVARDHASVQLNLPKTNRATFHEVRSLSIFLFSKKYDLERVQELSAHTDPKMTIHYRKGHEEEWTEINMALDYEESGGNL